MAKKNGKVKGYSKTLFVIDDGGEIKTFDSEKAVYDEAQSIATEYGDEIFVSEYKLVRVAKVKVVKPAMTWEPVK
jgi:hypothetical protein